jgi:hypothetical protein
MYNLSIKFETACHLTLTVTFSNPSNYENAYATAMGLPQNCIRFIKMDGYAQHYYECPDALSLEQIQDVVSRTTEMGGEVKPFDLSKGFNPETTGIAPVVSIFNSIKLAQGKISGEYIKDSLRESVSIKLAVQDEVATPMVQSYSGQWERLSVGAIRNDLRQVLSWDSDIYGRVAFPIDSASAEWEKLLPYLSEVKKPALSAAAS